jgi:hypothetical protein
MTIGNLSSKFYQMPSMESIVLVSPRAIPIKHRKIPLKWHDEQRQTNWEVLNEVFHQLLQPLIFEQCPSPKSGYYNSLCADGNLRVCKPILAACLGDGPEYSNLHQLDWHVCFSCKCSTKQLGEYVPPDKQNPWWGHILYRTLSHANSNTAFAELTSCHVHPGFNVFQHTPCVVSSLPMPNLFQTMQTDKLDHLQRCIIHLMKSHELLDKYNAIRLSMPAYHCLIPQTKSYEEVFQWNGKEMKEMSRYLHGVVTKSLQGGSPSKRSIFNGIIECTWVMLEFFIYARCKSHDDATLS